MLHNILLVQEWSIDTRYYSGLQNKKNFRLNIKLILTSLKMLHNIILVQRSKLVTFLIKLD